MSIKKISAVFLLSLFALVYTPCSELFKIPAFIEHFKEHHQNNSLSLLAFIKLHYFNNHTQKDADYEKDMQLPFMKGECTMASLSVNVITAEEKLIQEPPIVHLKKNKFPIVHENPVSNYLSLIWQPPKQSVA